MNTNQEHLMERFSKTQKAHVDQYTEKVTTCTVGKHGEVGFQHRNVTEYQGPKKGNR